MIRSFSPLVLPAAAIAPLVLIAACGGSPAGNDSAAATNAAGAGDTAATIRALPAGQRTAVLLRAIRDAGRDCQTVTQAVEVTAAGSPPTWAATCEDRDQWIVALGTDGTATVTSRANVRQAGTAG